MEGNRGLLESSLESKVFNAMLYGIYEMPVSGYM